MILCTQNFFNELDLLEIKLNTLAGHVDKFLIGEATHTYSGIPKPLHFLENKDRFKDFPIHHVIVKSLEGEMNPWVREGHQRDWLWREAIKLRPEIIIWGDLDEIIRPEAIHEFERSKHRVMAWECDWLRYYFNRVCRQKWKQRVISRDDRHHCGFHETDPVLKDAGWHCNFCTDQQMLLDKINATSHVVDPETPWYREEVKAGRHPQIELTDLYDESKLPPYILKNRARFEDRFWKPENGLI